MKKAIRSVLGAAALMALSAVAHAAANAAPWSDIGRDATPAEVKAWDIDVRPDFKGLPPGKGNADLGADIWETKCASCHGVFGESNEVFTPIIGGTTAEDMKTGHVSNLLPGKNFPQRTTIMKVATVSTLWDYINRAMPWNAPKTLSTDEVYSVLAYLLSLAEIVDTDFELNQDSIKEVQKRMPNRNGMVMQESLWRADGKGDVQNTACMKDCPTEVKITSSLPDFARDAHGNIQDQNRLVGAVRGADTDLGPAKSIDEAKARAAQALKAAEQGPAPAKAGAASGGLDEVAAKKLLGANACTACHGMTTKLVGPAFSEIQAKYKDRADALDYLKAKIKAGGVGVWGSVPMPAQAQLNDADLATLATWVMQGEKK
jgi:S-disulfanyl-L-cysteine oxidoreductase SoxD